MDLYFQILLYVTVGGVLFSGYLSCTRFFTKTCAFNESCPVFMGYSACYFGFAMFFIMFLITLLGYFNPMVPLVWLNMLISFLGILFAGYFTVPEVKLFLRGETNYSLGLPTCSYGLVFYTLIFVLSVTLLL